MAKKAQSFKLDEKHHAIVIYSNVTPTEAEKELKEVYIKLGYIPKFEEKKPSLTIEQMRSELEKSGDAELLEKFNTTYSDKANKKAFFDACKIYTSWKKNSKKKK